MVATQQQIEAYIRQQAQARGIDPEIAVRVWKSEGAGGNPAEAWQSKVINKKGVREESFGPFQMYTGGGMGNEFQQQTGLNLRDPNTWKSQVNYALDATTDKGWKPWYGAKNAGIGDYEGLPGKAAPIPRPRPGSNSNYMVAGGEGNDSVMGAAGNDTFGGRLKEGFSGILDLIDRTYKSDTAQNFSNDVGKGAKQLGELPGRVGEAASDFGADVGKGAGMLGDLYQRLMSSGMDGSDAVQMLRKAGLDEQSQARTKQLPGTSPTPTAPSISPVSSSLNPPPVDPASEARLGRVNIDQANPADMYVGNSQNPSQPMSTNPAPLALENGVVRETTQNQPPLVERNGSGLFAQEMMGGPMDSGSGIGISRDNEASGPNGLGGGQGLLAEAGKDKGSWTDNIDWADLLDSVSTGLMSMSSFPTAGMKAQLAENQQRRGERRKDKRETKQRNRTAEWAVNNGLESYADGIATGVLDLKTAVAMEKGNNPSQLLTSAQLNEMIPGADVPPGRLFSLRGGDLKQVTRGGTVVSVSSGDEGALSKKLGEETAKLWSSIEAQANKAAGFMTDLDSLEQALAEGSTSPLYGRFVELFPGFDNAATVAHAIVSKMAPRMRVEGSGSTSNFEVQQMMNALPRFRNWPEANKHIIAAFRKKAVLDQQRGALVMKFKTGEMAANEVYREMHRLNQESIFSPELKQFVGPESGEDYSKPPEGVSQADWNNLTPEEKIEYFEE